MQNNNLTNINMNKVLQDRLSTQMSTEKKISKPSDDPVIAIRALRLRGNVTEVTQYYSKNIPDAESWLNVTEGALKNTSSIITNMIAQCTKGSNGDLTSKEREIILEQLKALRDEVYSPVCISCVTPQNTRTPNTLFFQSGSLTRTWDL